TRWDTAIIDPPVAISARGRSMRFEAFNRRGEALLPLLTRVVEPLTEVTITGREPRLVTLEIAAPGRVLTEEERSRAPSVFSVLRAIVGLFRTELDADLGLFGAFGYDLAFQFDPVE